MLLVDCPACSRRHLRSVHSIERLENTPAGMVLTVSCAFCHHRCRIPGARRPDAPRDTDLTLAG